MPFSPFVDPAMARRLEGGHTWRSINYSTAYQKLHPDAACAVQEIAGGAAVFVRPGSPLNSAAGIGMNGPVSPADLDALENFYFGRGAPVRVHVCPLADESLWYETARRGYQLDFFFSVLFLPIPEDFTPQPLSQGMRVTQAKEEDAGTWLKTVSEGFGGPNSPSPESLDILGPNFFAPESKPFFAWIGDQPAGGGGMYYHDSVVELGGASTRPEFRRRGVQRALIEARLASARVLGCDLALVLTEPGSDSQRNLQRAGFLLAYTKPLIVKGIPNFTEY